MPKWLTDGLRRVAPLAARQLVQVVLTVAVSSGLVSAACGADVQRLLLLVKPFGL